MDIGISQFLSLDFALVVVGLIVNMGLIFVVYSQDKRSATNVSFVVLALLLTIWTTVIYIDRTIGPNLFLARLSLFVAAPMSIAFYLFARALPEKTFRIPWKIMFIIILSTVVVMILNASPYVFTDLLTDEEGVATVAAGAGIIPFAILSTLSSIAALFELFRKFIYAKGIQRRQFQFVLSALVFILVLTTATVLIPIIIAEDYTYLRYVPLYVLGFLFLTTFAVLKYQLFEVRLVATESIVVVLMITLLAEAIISGSLVQFTYKVVFAIVIGFMGIFLVRSVKKEIKQKEELSRLTVKLKRTNSKLKELDDLKTEFLSIASHQLRTPLSIIKGYTALLQEGAYGKITKDTNDVLHNIDISNERLVKLVDEFLNISRMEQGRTKFFFESVDFVPVAEGIVTELKEKAGPKNITLTMIKPDEMPLILIDSEKIRHCLYNFVDNAIKYSPEGSEVQVILESEKNGFQARVLDQGAGMDKKDIKNLFQKFYRSPHVMRDFQGTGLGLYVVKQFAEAHGGKVWAKSKGIKKGSEFGFWVPAVPKGKAYDSWKKEQEKKENV